MMRFTSPLALLFLASLAADTRAQGFTAVLKDGDLVTGVGNVTSISNVAVNDSVTWLVEVDTDNVDTNADGAIVSNFATLLVENQSLPAPVGALLDSFDAVNVNASGNSCWNLFLDGTSGSSDDSGVYFNTTLVIQESDVSTAAGFSAGTAYKGFFEVKLNDTGDALVMASVDDPAIASTTDRALVVLDLDGSGNLLSETVIGLEGDAPAQLLGDTVTDFETGPHNFAYNDAGLAAYVVNSTSTFGGVHSVWRGTTMLAREGEASPELGRLWQLLGSRPLALNDNGTLLFRGNLDGDDTDDEVLVLTNTTGTSQIIMREGWPVATATGVYLVQDFGSGAPLGLSDDGDTLWFADWNDPDTSRDEGLFYNGHLIVQEGVTQVGLDTIESVGTGVQDLFSLSPDGNTLIFECKLTGGVDAVVLADLSLGLDGPFCDDSDGSLASCPCGNAGAPSAGCDIAALTGGVRLSMVTQQTTPQNRATLTSTGYSTMGSPATVLIRAPGLDTATPVVFGDGLRCVGTPVVRLGATVAAGGAGLHTFGHGTMVGAGTFHYQAWFRNTPIMFCDPVAAFDLSNGLTITWP